MPTPTVRRLQLGNELRHLRERAGKTLDEAAKIIDRSPTSASKLENGITGIKANDLRALIQYYDAAITAEGGDPVDLDWYFELNKGAANRGRWTGYRSTYPKYFRMAVDLEADAQAINIYQNEVVHGLFQTEDYMRAMLAEAQVRKDDETTEGMVRARLARQHVITKAGARTITLVLSESSLHRMIGDPELMRGQLTHLADVAKRPNIQLQILPFRCRTAPSTMFPFAHVQVASAGREAPPLEYIYVEQYNNGHYLDGLQDIRDYNALWNRLLGTALDPVSSQELLLQTADRFR
ncbi:helix-turn-helix domain-containing protein [Amycolatopsis cihanbeyliensis]|uniref:Helix-turn-helix protein n=1 Tax=Amycolatopsis cihanbeyliensis TaxID=1128664 RepID=A0A542CTP9_AMYCI|nr:helix-turn-helix transcriptional regulator [Amycolatopsis cihanbeyliensis]TQI94199.1 helix-turn-helix protein [Amycolatopsis cihanbeyliensis]